MAQIRPSLVTWTCPLPRTFRHMTAGRAPERASNVTFCSRVMRSSTRGRDPRLARSGAAGGALWVCWKDVASRADRLRALRARRRSTAPGRLPDAPTQNRRLIALQPHMHALRDQLGSGLVGQNRLSPPQTPTHLDEQSKVAEALSNRSFGCARHSLKEDERNLTADQIGMADCHFQQDLEPARRHNCGQRLASE